jgi:hypothetical protein
MVVVFQWRPVAGTFNTFSTKAGVSFDLALPSV